MSSLFVEEPARPLVLDGQVLQVGDGRVGWCRLAASPEWLRYPAADAEAADASGRV